MDLDLALIKRQILAHGFIETDISILGEIDYGEFPCDEWRIHSSGKVVFIFSISCRKLVALSKSDTVHSKWIKVSETEYLVPVSGGK